MMGLFRSKKPASEGVLQIATASFLTTQDEIDIIAVDGIRTAAYVHAYIREIAPRYGASGALFDHLEEAVWQAACPRYPHLTDKFLIFVTHVVRASRIEQDLHTVAAASAYYEVTDKEQQWSFDDPIFAEWTTTMLQVVDNMFAQAAVSWKPDA